MHVDDGPGASQTAAEAVPRTQCNTVRRARSLSRSGPVDVHSVSDRPGDQDGDGGRWRNLSLMMSAKARHLGLGSQSETRLIPNLC